MPVIVTLWLIAPLNILQGIYAKYYGLPLTIIATIFLLARFFDAISDPLIGYLSDRYYRENETYKPIILVGGLLFIASSYFLYIPPAGVTSFYFTVWLLLFYFSWSLFEMPHMAWPSKLASSSQAKAKIYSYRSIAGYTGLLSFYSIPLLPVFENTSITPETLKYSVLIAASLMLPFLMLCLKTVPTSTISQSYMDKRYSEKVASKKLIKKQSLRGFCSSLTSNKPLIVFFGAYLMFSISSGMWYSLIFLYVDVYLSLGEKFAQMFLLAFGIGIASTPVWYKLVIWYGKKITWVIASSLTIFSFIYTGFLSPDNTGFKELAVLKIVQTLGFTCINLLAPAMLSEIIDFSNWKYRSDKSAIYFSIHTFMYKSAIAIATALGLGVAGIYGFDATADMQSEKSIFGVTLAIAWVPSALAVIGLFFILFLPLDERRHAIIRRRLTAIAA